MTDDEAPRAIHAIVRGRVQNVCFRAFVQEKATALGLIGFVQNRIDGTVEAVAEGSASAIDAFCTWLREEGSPLSRVDEVVRVDRTPEGRYQGFTIRR